MKKILWSIAAAFTTPEAIKAEKHVGVIAATRFAVLVPSAGFAIAAGLRVLGWA